jgi:hypothetical protein
VPLDFLALPVALQQAHVFTQRPGYRVLVFLGTNPLALLFTLVKALLGVFLRAGELTQGLPLASATQLRLISLLHFRYQIAKVY